MITNSDRIRAMTDAELEDFLMSYVEPYKVCAIGKELNEFNAAVLREATVGGYGRADDGHKNED